MSDETPPPSARKRQALQIKKEIMDAILKAQAAISDLTLKKLERNDADGYDYVSVDQYYREIAPIINGFGLSWTTRLENVRYLPADGTEPPHVQMDVEIDLKFRDGTVIQNYSCFPAFHEYKGAQTAGSVMSYADKLFMRAEFKVATGEKDADQYSSRAASRAKIIQQHEREQRLNGVQNGAPVQTQPNADTRDNPAVVSAIEADAKRACEAAYRVTYLEQWWRNHKPKLDALRNGNIEERAIYDRIVSACERRKAALLAQRSGGVRRTHPPRTNGAHYAPQQGAR